MREKKEIRLFFALWPSEKVRDQLEAFIHSIPPPGGRDVPLRNWHMTLHFIGNTSFDEKNCLNRQAGKVKATAFELTVNQTGFFRKPKVFWLGCEKPPEALFNLQKKLGRKISRCEYIPETRPYSPHITIARKVVRPPESVQVNSIEWLVDEFVLIESVSVKGGVRYRVIETYPLSK